MSAGRNRDDVTEAVGAAGTGGEDEGERGVEAAGVAGVAELRVGDVVRVEHVVTGLCAGDFPSDGIERDVAGQHVGDAAAF